MVFQVRLKLMILALVAGVLIAAVPALAQDDTSGYTSTTPTVTTPTTTTPKTTTEENDVADDSSGGGGNGSASSGSGELAETGSDTWMLLAIGGALALGSALLLARERLPRRSK